MSKGGFIKIDRSILSWEYYGVPQAVALWLHILIKANWTTGYFQGIEVKRGQFVTSIRKLAQETGLTIQQTRTYLNNMQNNKQITCKTTNKYTLISVVKYDTYQGLIGSEQQTKQQTNNTQTNKQITNKQQQYKNNKNIKNIKKEGSKLPTPTLEEVIAYCEARHSNINPTRFYNYYNQRNWLVGGKVIDWQLKVTDWEQSEYNNKPRVNNMPTYIRNQKQGQYKQGKKAKKETLDKVKEMQGKKHGK